MPAYTKLTTYFNAFKSLVCTEKKVINTESLTVYVGINPYTTVNNRQQTDAGLELQQATRRLSDRGRVLVGVGGCRHRRGGFLQAKSQQGTSSYHVYLAFSGQSWQLDVRSGCLDGFICGQETSSVNQAEKTETRKIQVFK